MTRPSHSELIECVPMLLLRINCTHTQFSIHTPDGNGHNLLQFNLKGLFGYMLLLHISEVDKQSILDNKW